MDVILAARWILRTIWSGLFLWFVWDMLISYVEQKTLILEEKIGTPSQRMPALTICSAKPFKSEGYHFAKSTFLKNTYSFDELFHPKTRDFLAKKNFSVLEYSTFRHGRCFLVSSVHDFLSSRERLTFWLNPGSPGISVRMHEPGAEIFMMADNWPKAVYEQETEEFEDKSMMCIVETEVFVFESMWDGQLSCQNWGNEDDVGANREFFKCAETRLREAWSKTDFACKNFLFEKYVLQEAAECDAGKELNESQFKHWMTDAGEFPQLFSAEPGRFGCPRPCKQYMFEMNCKEKGNVNNYHFLEGPEIGRIAKVSFSMKMELDTEVQQLLYDIPGVVAGVGASLGLFLGFSCLGLWEKCFKVLFDKGWIPGYISGIDA